MQIFEYRRLFLYRNQIHDLRYLYKSVVALTAEREERLPVLL